MHMFYFVFTYFCIFSFILFVNVNTNIGWGFYFSNECFKGFYITRKVKPKDISVIYDSVDPVQAQQLSDESPHCLTWTGPRPSVNYCCSRVSGPSHLTHLPLLFSNYLHYKHIMHKYVYQQHTYTYIYMFT